MNTKTAITLPSRYCLNPALLRHLKAYGFNGVDFLFDKDFFAQAEWDKTIDQICCNLDAAGLSCAQVHLPYYGMFESSETCNEEMESQILYSIKCMNRLGAAWGAHHPMSAVNFAFDTEKALQDNVQKIQNYLHTAEKYNVGIAMENLPFFYDNPQNRYFCSKAEELCELIDRLNHPLVGACWDFGHINLVGCDQFGNPLTPGYDTVKALKIMGNRVKIVHAHDNYGDYDSHHCPTFGTVKWYELLPILFQNDFPGYFSLECELKLPKESMLLPYFKLCAETARCLLEEISQERTVSE